MAMGIVGGVFAYQITESEVLMDWQKKHSPSGRVLEYTLRSFGMQEVHDLNQLQRIMRSLPVSTETSGTLWYSNDLEWTAYFDKSTDQKDDSTVLRGFCRSCAKPPQEWQPAAIGWTGLEQIVLKLQSRPKYTETSPPPQKRPRYRDPREIIY